jgi:carboxylesterase
MRPLGEYLYAHGVSVCAPLLPGHGTQPGDLNCVTRQDWLEEAERALAVFLEAGRPTFALGLSMGALIAAELAARHPELAGLVLYSPGIKVANRLAPLAPLLCRLIAMAPKRGESDLSDPGAEALLWHYDCWPTAGVAEFWRLRRSVRRRLRRIATPALIFHSTQDASIARDAGQIMYEALGAQDKELVHLHHSGHVMIVDIEREAIFAQTLGFIAAHLPRSGITSVEPTPSDV